MSRELTAPEKAQLESISKRTYKEQSQYILNAFWEELKGDAESVWEFWKKMIDLDKQQWNALCTAGKATGEWTEGASLDEFWSHKFLEILGKTMSIVEFRAEFKKIDATLDKRMGMLEFILYHKKLSVVELLSRPQGGDPAELAKAQALLQEVSAAFQAAQTSLDQASKTEAESKKTAEASAKAAAEAKKTAEEAQKTAEAAAKAAAEAKKTADEAAHAAAEQQAAVDALKHEEDSYNNKTKDLQAKSEAGGVSGMKAKNELAQHLGEDPLPLRKAKITAEAASKKTDKANQIAQAAKDAAEKDAATADAAKVAAEKAKSDAEAAKVAAEAAAKQAEEDRLKSEGLVKECEAKLAEAEAYLEEVKKKGDQTPGTFWWLDRELAEKKKYMPKSGKAKILM